MKRVLAFLCIIFYLFMGVGFYANAHYCSEELEKLSLGLWQSNIDCCTTNEEIEDSCCQNESQIFKIKDPHHKIGLTQSFKVLTLEDNNTPHALPFLTKFHRWFGNIILAKPLKPPAEYVSLLYPPLSFQEKYSVYRI